MSLGIGQTTHGYSQSGAADYKAELNTKAITETVKIVNDITAVTEAFQAGWQGQAEVNFEKNLRTAITEVTNGLESLKAILDAQFAQLEEVMVRQDSELVPTDE